MKAPKHRSLQCQDVFFFKTATSSFPKNMCLPEEEFEHRSEFFKSVSVTKHIASTSWLCSEEALANANLYLISLLQHSILRKGYCQKPILSTSTQSQQETAVNELDGKSTQLSVCGTTVFTKRCSLSDDPAGG